MPCRFRVLGLLFLLILVMYLDDRRQPNPAPNGSYPIKTQLAVGFSTPVAEQFFEKGDPGSVGPALFEFAQFEDVSARAATRESWRFIPAW
jgi:hypothetical protein